MEAHTVVIDISKTSYARSRRRGRGRLDEPTLKQPVQVANDVPSSFFSVPQRPTEETLTRNSFAEGLDFIPFNFSDAGADTWRRSSPVLNGQDKGKGKEKEVEVSAASRDGPGRDKAGSSRSENKGRDRTTGRDRRERSRDRERRGGRDRESSRERRLDDVENAQKERDRDWDRERRRDREGRGKRGRDASPDSYLNKKRRVDAHSRKCPWVDGIDWDHCHHVAEILHKEVEAFTNWISPTPVEDEVRGLLVQLITKAVKNAFPDASVIPFGSYETKLYLPLGDIDLVILSDTMAYRQRTSVLHALAHTLRHAGITDRVSVIAKAKVPIVKFVTTHGRFNVDISVNQENGVVSGKIIKGFLQDLHNNTTGQGSMALRSLVLVTKAFLSQRNMNEVFTGGLGSYSVVCLAISFLQMHPKIRRGEINADNNLGVLVMEFFELYGCYFNYEEVGISVRDGGTYFSKKERGWHDYNKSGLLSIEDPADPSNDISRGSYGFQKVRSTFAGAYGILTSRAYLLAGMLASRRQGRSMRFRDDDHPEEMSLLAHVMGVTQETINHRRLVRELYDKRTLHSLLGLKPKPVVVKDVSPSDGPSRKSAGTRASRSADVEAVWEKIDVHLDERDRKRQRELPENEDGRYSIGLKRQKKRQKANGPEEMVAAYTTDEAEFEPSLGSESEAEEAHYGNGGRLEDAQRRAERRSFWLSKGIGIEDAVS